MPWNVVGLDMKYERTQTETRAQQVRICTPWSCYLLVEGGKCTTEADCSPGAGCCQIAPYTPPSFLCRVISVALHPPNASTRAAGRSANVARAGVASSRWIWDLMCYVSNLNSFIAAYLGVYCCVSLLEAFYLVFTLLGDSSPTVQC